MLALALMFLHYRGSDAVDRVRLTLQRALTPVVELLFHPFAGDGRCRQPQP